MDGDSNRRRLQRLLDAGAIRLRPAPLLDSTPEPLETDDLEDRVRGGGTQPRPRILRGFLPKKHLRRVGERRRRFRSGAPGVLRRHS